MLFVPAPVIQNWRLPPFADGDAGACLRVFQGFPGPVGFLAAFQRQPVVIQRANSLRPRTEKSPTGPEVNELVEGTALGIDIGVYFLVAVTRGASR